MSNPNRDTQPVFKCFDKTAPVDISQRNLPHWFQPGAATFITFRMADSMPKEVLLRWQDELVHWLTRKRLPVLLAESIVVRRLPNHDQMFATLCPSDRREFKKLSDRAFHLSLDECHGSCVLRDPELAKIVGDAILFYDDVKYELDRFIVLPNHVHAIAQFRPGSGLKTVSQSWMRYTARVINKQIGKSEEFWQAEPFNHIIRSENQFEYLRDYVADNPKKAGLSSGEFLYWERS